MLARIIFALMGLLMLSTPPSARGNALPTAEQEPLTPGEGVGSKQSNEEAWVNLVMPKPKALLSQIAAEHDGSETAQLTRLLNQATAHLQLAQRDFEPRENLREAVIAINKARILAASNHPLHLAFVELIDCLRLIALSDIKNAKAHLENLKSGQEKFSAILERHALAREYHDYLVALLATKDGEHEQAVAILNKLLSDQASHFSRNNTINITLVNLKTQLILGEVTKVERGLQSLEKSLQKSDNPVLKGMYEKLIAEFNTRQEQHDSAIIHYQQAASYLEGHDLHTLNLVKFGVAAAHSAVGDVTKALKNYQSAKAHFSATRNVDMVARINANTGVMYQELGQTEKALPLYFDALRWAQRKGLSWAESSILNNIANLYQQANSFEQALAMYDRAIGIKEKSVDRQGYIDLHVNAGEVLGKLERFEEAKRYFGLALEQAQAIEYVTGQIRALRGYADISTLQAKYDEAEARFLQALSLMEQTDNLQTKWIVYESFGYLRYTTARYEEAEKLFKKALKITDITQRKNHQTEIYEHLSNLYQAMGNYEQANAFLTRLFKAKVFFAEESFNNAVAVMRADFELSAEQQEREKAMRLLEADNALKSATIRNGEIRDRFTYVILLSFSIILFLVLHKNYVSRKANRRLKLLNQRLEEISFKDPLTQLYNRRFLSKARQLDGRLAPPSYFFWGASGHSAVFLVDLDQFKSINDTWGHLAGDCVLVEFAKRLKSLVREGDCVIRWGGEEFLMVVNDISESEAKQFGERILRVCTTKPYYVDSFSLRINCSIGYCVFPVSEKNIDHLNWEEKVLAADKALYQAKESGKDCLVGHSFERRRMQRDGTRAANKRKLAMN